LICRYFSHLRSLWLFWTFFDTYKNQDSDNKVRNHRGSSEPFSVPKNEDSLSRGHIRDHLLVKWKREYML
jgi:hypothetical protein